MTIEQTRAGRRVPRRLTTRAALGWVLLLCACGEGPTAIDEPRLCRTQLREIAPLAPTTGARVLPLPVLPGSPVHDANCRADSPIIRLPADSGTIVTPIPRPNPVPLPGGD